jgi:predicted deacetylase
MKIAIRLDDITPDMDWEKFGRFKNLMDRYRVKPLIGVVPDNRDPNLSICPPREDFWDNVKRIQEEGWIIAMHGCHHLYTTTSGGMFPLNALSEFAGLPEENQSRLIAEGREIFEKHGIETDFFMAPAHSYDRHTLKVLKEHNFFRMTDGFGRQPYVYDGMTFYPISFNKASCLTAKDGATTFVVHVNKLSDSDFQWYENVFATQDMLPYPEYIYLPAVKQGPAGRFREYWMAAGKRAAVAARMAARQSKGSGDDRT